MKKLSFPAWNKTRPLAYTALAALLLFFLSVGFSLFLSAATLRQNTIEGILHGYENAATQLKALIDRGLNFGRPLNGFVGLREHLARTQDMVVGITGIAVCDGQGKTVAAVGWDLCLDDLAHTAKVPRTAWKKAGDYYRILPLGDAARPQGSLLIAVSRDGPERPYTQYMELSLMLLSVLGPLICLAMLGWFAYTVDRLGTGAGIRNTLRAMVLVFIGGSQIFFVGMTIRTFKAELNDAAAFSAALSASFLAANLEMLDHKKLRVQNFPGLSEHMERMLAGNPGLGGIRIQAGGKTLAEAGKEFDLTPASAPVYRYWPTSETIRAQIASVQVFPGETHINDVFQGALIDQLTALVVAFMLLMQFSDFVSIHILKEFIHRTHADEGPAIRTKNDRIRLQMVVFVFFGAYDMIISFIPLMAAQLPSRIMPLSDSLQKALPISTEAIFAALAIPVSGILKSRLGWKKMIWLSIAFGVCGALLGSLSTDILLFIVSRACSGFALSMLLMAIQFCIIETSKNRLKDLAGIYAALYAGGICGSSSGGMLYDLLPASAILALSALLTALPALVLAPVAGSAPRRDDDARPSVRFRDSWRAFLSPAVLAPVLLVSVPTGMSLTGFLYLSIPVLMKQMAFDQADIGRLFMLFCFCFIVIGPWLAHIAQKRASLTPFVSMAGMAAGLSIVVVSVFPSAVGFTAGALLMGVSQCLLSSTAQEYIFLLPVMKGLDRALISSVYRMCQRAGQIVGPVLFGAALAGEGISLLTIGLVLTGSAMLFLASKKLFS